MIIIAVLYFLISNGLSLVMSNAYLTRNNLYTSASSFSESSPK